MSAVLHQSGLCRAPRGGDPAVRLAHLRHALGLALAAGLLAAGCRSTQVPASIVARATTTADADVTGTPPKPAPFRGALTLETAIARAQDSSADLALLTSDVDVAKQEKLVAGIGRDPELRLAYGEADADASRDRVSNEPLSTGIGTRTTVDSETGYDIGLRVFPENPWARNHRIATAEAGIHARVAQLRNAKWSIANEVRRLFIQIHFLSANLESDRQLTALYREALRIEQDRAAQGHGTAAEIMAASRRYLESLSDRDRTLREHDEVRRELAALVAIPFDDVHLVMDPSLLNTPAIGDLSLARLEQEALNKRHDLSALHWERVQAEAAYQEAKAIRRPWLSYVQASYGMAESTSRSQGLDLDASAGGVSRLQTTADVEKEDQDEWQVDAGISLPILPRGKHEVSLRFAEFRRAELQETKGRERIRREIVDALTAVKVAVASRERYRVETMPLVREMENLLRKLEAETGLDPIEVARMREELLEANRVELRAAREYHLAVVRLEEVLGMHLPAAAPTTTPAAAP